MDGGYLPASATYSTHLTDVYWQCIPDKPHHWVNSETHTCTHNRLTAFDPGLPWYSGTRRNIHRLMPILIIGQWTSFIGFLHLLWSIASSDWWIVRINYMYTVCVWAVKFTSLWLPALHLYWLCWILLSVINMLPLACPIFLTVHL